MGEWEVVRLERAIADARFAAYSARCGESASPSGLFKMFGLALGHRPDNSHLAELTPLRPGLWQSPYHAQALEIVGTLPSADLPLSNEPEQP